MEKKAAQERMDTPTELLQEEDRGDGERSERRQNDLWSAEKVRLFMALSIKDR